MPVNDAHPSVELASAVPGDFVTISLTAPDETRFHGGFPERVLEQAQQVAS